MAKARIQINRAPVLTLWAAVVAERLGYDAQTALTLGKAVAGLNAQSKGQRLGIYGEKTEEEKEIAREEAAAVEAEFVQIMGRAVAVVETPRGLRAAIKGEPIHAESVEKYLRQKFGDDLDGARTTMRKLAAAYQPRELESKAFGLYEKFRPEIPEGVKGWGAKGELDLDYIASLASRPCEGLAPPGRRWHRHVSLRSVESGIRLRNRLAISCGTLSAAGQLPETHKRHACGSTWRMNDPLSATRATASQKGATTNSQDRQSPNFGNLAREKSLPILPCGSILGLPPLGSMTPGVTGSLMPERTLTRRVIPPLWAARGRPNTRRAA